MDMKEVKIKPIEPVSEPDAEELLPDTIKMTATPVEK